MKVFLDTNIIIDFFDSDRGHYMPTAIIFDLAIKKEIELVACAQSFITAFYILRKSYDKYELCEKLLSIAELCTVTPVDSAIIETSLREVGVDFEDTVQYFSSCTISDVDIILTRDRKGFNEFPVKHVSAETFLDEYFA